MQEKIEKSKQLVKIHNDLTNEKLSNLNAKELDLFMAICHKMLDKGTNEVTITFGELRELGNYKENSNERLKNLLLDANKKLLSFIIQIDHNDFSSEQKTLFKKFKTNSKDAVITVEVWEETAYILNNFVGNFTIFELTEYITLSSKYSKRLYKLLKQFRTQGLYYTNKEDFYKALNVPTSYKNADFNKRVLKPALEECSKFFVNLTCEIIKAGRGGAVQGYKFYFDKEITEKKKKKENNNRNKFNNFMQSNILIDDEFEKNIISN